MKRFIMFSHPQIVDIDEVLKLMLPKSLKNKVLGYITPDGRDSFLEVWKDWCLKYDYRVEFIDIRKPASVEQVKDMECLLLAGGNTFEMLQNLKESGLYKVIKNRFGESSGVSTVLTGFSAGALVMTPTIKICNLPMFDENFVGLKDLKSLGFVDFEVFPHFEERYSNLLDEYADKNQVKVKPIADDEFIVVEK